MIYTENSSSFLQHHHHHRRHRPPHRSLIHRHIFAAVANHDPMDPRLRLHLLGSMVHQLMTTRMMMMRTMRMMTMTKMMMRMPMRRMPMMMVLFSRQLMAVIAVKVHPIPAYHAESIRSFKSGWIKMNKYKWRLLRRRHHISTMNNNLLQNLRLGLNATYLEVIFKDLLIYTRMCKCHVYTITHRINFGFLDTIREGSVIHYKGLHNITCPTNSEFNCNHALFIQLMG